MSHHTSLHLPLLTGHLWLHIWCGLDRCAFIGPYFFVTHITYATTNANTCVQKRINKCTHMQQQMHKILFCENMIFLICFVITLNRTLFSQNKTVCICWCIYSQIYLHIHLHLFRICLHLFQHLRFVPVHLQTYNM
jgi:hypothetical protein